MSASTEVRILLVDDSALVRHGVKSVLQCHRGEPRFSVVGEAGSVAEAVSEAARVRPDLVLLDLRLPDGYGFTACRDILRSQPQTRILVLTAFADDNFVYESITAGVHGYLMKDIDPSALIDAITRVARGESILSPDLASRVLAMVRAAGRKEDEGDVFTSLSPQEKRVLELVVKGKTNAEIGVQLGLSDNTVKNYLGNVFEKLNVKRRAEAAALYARKVRRPARPDQA